MSMNLLPRLEAAAAVAVLGLGLGACSGPQQASVPRYEQLVRCNAVTVIVGRALPPTFPNAAEIRASTGRIAEALATEAEASGKTRDQVLNDMRAAAAKIETDAQAGDADHGRRLVEEATRCVDLVER